MPLSDDFLSSIFGPANLSQDNPQSQADNFLSSLDDPVMNTGLDPLYENPYAGIHSDTGIWGGVTGRAAQFVGSVANTMLGMGAVGADLFETARKSQWELDAKLSELLGNQEKAQEIREYSKYQDPLGAMEAVAGSLRAGANYASDVVAANAPPMEHGGSVIDEIQADLGITGDGYNPLSYSWDPTQIQPIELVKDVIGNVGSTAAGMAGMAAASGGLAAIPQYGTIGTGMAMQTYQDTYLNNTENPDDSRLLAIGAAAANAGVAGYLENLGWETALGRGAVADAFKGAANQPRLATMGVRGLYSALTEGGEELLQGVVDVLAKRLPDAQQMDWADVTKNVYSDMASQLPEAAFGGALFGGVLGGATGAMKIGMADVGARHGNADISPEEQLANSLNKGPASNDAKSVAIDAANNVVDSVDPLDLEPIEYERSDAFVGPLDKMETRRRNDKLKRLEKIAKNSMAHKEAADQAIVDEVAEAESQREEIANTLAEEDVTKIGTAMQNSVLKNGIEAEGKVAQLHAMWQQFSAMMQGQAVQMDNPEAPEDVSYSEPVVGMAVQITPGEAIAAMAEKAVELGVALPDALIADPDNFDWQSWGEQEKATAEGMAKAALAPSAKAITDAIPVDPAHPINSVISGLTEPPVASQRAPSAVLVAQQVKEATRQQKARAGENVATASPKWYVPNVLPAAHVHAENNLLDMIGSSKDLTEVDSNSVWGHIANKFGLENVVAAGVGNDIATYIKARNAIASGNVSKPVRNAMINAVGEIERKILMQQVPDFDGTVPDIEALSTYTASMAFKYKKSAMSPGAQLNKEVAASDLENPDIATAIANENAAQAMVPWVKTALFNIWQTAPKDLQNRVAIAISGNPVHDPNLGRDVMRHLAAHGMYKAAAQRAEVDVDYATRIGLAIGGVGKGVMSPYAMKRVLVENGVAPDVVDSTLAVMAAMATSWSRQNNASKFEFWDRMGDQVRLMNYAQSNVAGFARASSKRNSKMMSALVEGGRGLMSIFMGLDRSTVKVALHESIHSLFMSGLMWEMLDQQARDAMEKFAGEKLWGPDGEPLEISSKAHEMLAVGFEKFIYLNKAPTKAMEAAFKSVKEFIRDTIYHFLKSTGIIGAVFTDYEVRDMLIHHPENERASGAYPAYQFDTTKVDLKWGDFKMGLATTRAYYQLLNTEFDGTEVKWIAPGVAKAYESRLAAVTGLPADGVVSQVAPGSVSDGYSSGWQIDSGAAPTQDQWRTMAGLTNDESNGTHTQEAEFAVEANRVALGELSKVIKENPAPPASQQHITNKAVQASVAEEAPMLGSAEHDELMGTFYDQLLAGGKDIYNSGKLLDFSDMPSVKDMLSNFSSKMRRWAYEFDKGLLNGIKWVTNDYMKGEMKDSVQPFIKIMRAFETRLGNVGAPWERMLSSLSGMTMQERERIVSSLGPNATEEQKKKALADKTNEYLQMNLPSWAMAFNNHFAISKLAEKVAELPPMIWNSMGTERIPIPGGKSYNRIVMDFTKLTDAFWKENKDRLPYRDVNEYNKAIQRDFRMYLLAARQKELEKNVRDDMRKYEAALKKWESQQVVAKKKAKAESTDLALVMPEKIAKPAKPKLPKITEQGSHYAEAIMALLNSRYGKDVSMFTATAAELTQWENHMVLGKLLNANMINQKSYDDMVRKGKAHIPMYRLRAALEHSGARNVRLDASVYRVLDYLKNDISVSMEDPLNAMLRRAKAVMVLTERQHAKNAIGKRILADVKWWAIDNPNSKIGIFSDKVEITKDEWDELVAKDEKDRPYMVTSEEVYKKTPMNTRIHKGFKYFKHVPFTSAQVEEGLKHVVASARRKKQLTAKQEQAIQDRVDHSLFAFYPEPGKAMYVYIADPELAEAFFYMNNPQAMFANSVKGQITNFIAGMKGADHQASVADRIAYETAKTLHTGYFGFQKVAKRMITSNLAFVTNVLARDLPQAMARSRHGLRLRDVPRAIQQSMASMFPSIAEINPDKYSAALDAEQGMSTFSGLAASNSKGELDADVIFELMRGRSDREALAKHGSFKSKLQLMHNDFSQFLAKEGMNKSISQIKNELLRGENVFDNLVIVAKSPLMVPLSMFQALGTIMENTTRLAERGMTMSEDMSQYPTLAPKYDPSKAINGKLLAGFDGTSHRIAWERAKAKLKVDPNYAVPEEALPKQFDAHQRDYAETNITLNFAQKGTWTQNIDDFSLFFNPMAQDFYTNAMIILQHSYLKKAVAQAMGETYVPSHNQPRLDEAAWRWMYKSIFYMTLPAIASVGIYGTGDDDDSLDWQAQSFIEKMSYYWIPVNKLAPSLFKRPIRMATGLGLASLIFHDLPMAGFLDATGRDNAAMKKWMDRFFDATPIGLVMNPIKAYQENGAVGAIQNIAGQSVMAPELVNPIMEVMADRDEFRNRGIKVNTAFDQREPAEIGSERYNILVNTIARNFNSSKLQPAQVDYMIRRYFPGALRAIPQLANKAMEMSTGAEGVPEDMMASNSPLARPVTGILPKVSTTPAWGMGNEFVRDLLSTAREAEEKMNTYEDLVETRKPQYMAQNKLIQPDIYWGRNGSGGLKNAAAWVINKDKEKRALLKAGAITPLEASMMEREYTLFAMHAMSNVLDQLGRN